MAEAKKSEEPQVPFRFQLGNTVFEGQIAVSFLKAIDQVDSLQIHFSDKQFSDKLKVERLDLMEKDRQVEELLFQGRTTKTISLGNHVPVEFQTNTTDESLSLDTLPPRIKIPEGAQASWGTDINTVRLLAQVIKRFGGTNLETMTEAEREKFILSRPRIVSGLLGKQWNRWMDDLEELLDPSMLGGYIKKS